MKIIIFEDDPSDLSILEECIHTLFIDLHKSYSLKICKHPNEVLENIGDADLIFLDIENDQKINGIELGIQIRNMNRVIPIIFISNYSQYLIDGYKAHANRYFLKPLNKTIFSFEMKSILKSYSQEYDGFYDKHISHHKVFYNRILYIEFFNRKTEIYLLENSNPFITPYSLKYWKEKLPQEYFSQPYKSLLVNLNHIRGFSADKIILCNNQSLPLSRHYKQQFEEDFIAFSHWRI